MKLACNIFSHKFLENHKQGKKTHYKYSCTRCGEESDYPDMNKWENTFWDSDAWIYTKSILVVLLGTVAIISLMIFISSLVGKVSCNSYAEMGIPVQWNFWVGCMANHPKFGWIPVDEYFSVLNLNIP
jgi:hypothetical protein